MLTCYVLHVHPLPPALLQLFPHGPATSTPHREGPTMSEKIQHAQADLYSNIKDKASEVGEAIKGNIANTDQSTTTALRDATAAATSKVNEASSTVAGQAGGLLEKAKEAVKVCVRLAVWQARCCGGAAFSGSVTTQSVVHAWVLFCSCASGWAVESVAAHMGNDCLRDIVCHYFAAFAMKLPNTCCSCVPHVGNARCVRHHVYVWCCRTCRLLQASLHCQPLPWFAPGKSTTKGLPWQPAWYCSSNTMQ